MSDARHLIEQAEARAREHLRVLQLAVDRGDWPTAHDRSVQLEEELGRCERQDYLVYRQWAPGASGSRTMNAVEWGERASHRIAAGVRIAAEVHAGQVDKGGAPYILHPIAIMGMVEWQDIDNPHDRAALLCAAVLHDAVEDSPDDQKDSVRERIYRECGARAEQVVDRLTRYRDDRYLEDYIPRIEGDWIARRVKLADLAHNMDVTRLGDAAPPAERIARYQAAVAQLEAAEARWSS